MHFPDLRDTVGICNDIYFLQGGEIAHPQNLTYSRAHVQFNFGLTNQSQPQIGRDEPPVKDCEIDHRLEYSALYTAGTIERNQWNMLSAPMHSMVSGDFAFGGYPLTFMRKFDTTAPSQGDYPTGTWTGLYAALNEELALGEGFIIWMNEYQDADAYKEIGEGTDDPVSTQPRTYGIHEVNGILELPYYQDSIMEIAHRIHTHNGNQSKFNYVWEQHDANFLTVMNDADYYDRGDNDKAYRFIVEEYENGAWQFPVTSTKTIENTNNVGIEALVGNPYMSTIDFTELYADNSSNIQPQYRLWTGDGFVTVTLANGQVTSSDGQLDQYISPMQSFFILTQDGSGTFDLVYNVENITVPRPIDSGSQLRSQVRERNILRIKAENDLYSSHTLIGKSEAASDAYVAGEDVYKLFSQKTSVPEVYTLMDNYALEMNFIESDYLLIPVGLKTQKTGATKFTFTGMDMYDAEKIEFIDSYLSQTIDLTGKDRVEYEFNNMIQGAYTGRFFIKFSADDLTVNLEPETQLNIEAYRNENGIFITTASDNAITQVIAYDMLGNIIYRNDAVNTNLFTLNNRIEVNPVVVKVVTERGVANIKLIK